MGLGLGLPKHPDMAVLRMLQSHLEEMFINHPKWMFYHYYG